MKEEGMKKGERIEIVDFGVLFLLIPSPASGIRENAVVAMQCYNVIMSCSLCNWIWFWRGCVCFEFFFYTLKKEKTTARHAVKPRFFILRVPFLVGTLLLATSATALPHHLDLLTGPKVTIFQRVWITVQLCSQLLKFKFHQVIFSLDLLG